MRSSFNYCTIIADIDNAICCFSWPLTILWNYLGLPRMRQSILTRVRYISLLFIVNSICFLMLSAKSWLIFDDKVCTKIGYRTCELIHGPAPVYRAHFLLFLYFSIMSVCMIGVENTKSWRAIFHNHFWTFKSFLLAGGIVLFILLPRTVYSGEVWHFFGLNCAFAFIVLQFVILVDSVHAFNTKIVDWMDKPEHLSSSKYCFIVLWLPTSFFYIISILSTVTFYKMYSSKTDCATNMFFISFHVYMCAAATFISVHPVVQEARPKSGLLQSSIVTAYSTFILWLTLSNQPDDICNPNREYLYPIDPLKNEQIVLSIVVTFFILFIFAARIVDAPQYGKHLRESQLEEQTIEDEFSRFEQTRIEEENLNEFCRNAPRLPTIIDDDELKGVGYSYSFFYLILSISSLYLMMSMTNWYRPEEEENLTVKLVAGWGAIWIKLCSGIFCVFLYIWSLVGPVIFPHSYRDLVFYEMIFSTPS